MPSCIQCKYWNPSDWIMTKYGEGCGKCGVSGEITFCSHQCPIAVLEQGSMAVLEQRSEEQDG